MSSTFLLSILMFMIRASFSAVDGSGEVWSVALHVGHHYVRVRSGVSQAFGVSNGLQQG